MNRKQRRDAAKRINTPQKLEEVIGIALDRQRADMLKAFKEEKKELINIMMVMVAYTLNYKLELGKKRLAPVVDTILDNIDAFRTGHLTKEDYEEIKESLKKYGLHF